MPIGIHTKPPAYLSTGCPRKHMVRIKRCWWCQPGMTSPEPIFAEPETIPDPRTKHEKYPVTDEYRPRRQELERIRRRKKRAALGLLPYQSVKTGRICPNNGRSSDLIAGIPYEDHPENVLRPRK